MPDLFVLAAVVIVAYLIGAIPTGLLMGRLVGRDPTRSGSGKTGAANTFRSAGPFAGAIVLVVDLLKGALVIGIARAIEWPNEATQGVALGLAGAAAIIGHNWSVWVRLLAGRWGGGRGIMVGLGAMLMISPWVALAALLVGALVIALTRYMALGAIAGALAGVGVVVWIGVSGAISPWLVPGAVLWGLLVILGFHDNMGRLLRGQESRLGAEETSASGQ